MAPLLLTNACPAPQLNEDDEELVCVNVYPHHNAVSALACSPRDPSRLLSAHSAVAGGAVEPRLTLWKLAGDEINTLLEPLADLASGATSLLWEETAADTVFAADARQLCAWNPEASASQPSLAISLGETASAATAATGGLSINPHFSSVVAVCFGDAVLAFDLREAPQHGKCAWKIAAADADRMRDVDFNPNRPYYLCGGGVRCCCCCAHSAAAGQEARVLSSSGTIGSLWTGPWPSSAPATRTGSPAWSTTRTTTRWCCPLVRRSLCVAVLGAC